ncbi:MAG: T9SS type A sorting domain-containing protein [Ignavibacteria bacterium]|nr:T9SS type A sorting domain-containing protein [Ignavibacteria bacterium]
MKRLLMIPISIFVLTTSLSAQRELHDHFDLRKNLISTTHPNHTIQVDMGDSASFSVIGRWAWGAAKAVAISGKYALMGQGLNYTVFDISNPSCPSIVYDTTVEARIVDIKIKDSLLIILSAGDLEIYRASQLFPLVQIGRSEIIPGLSRMSISDSLIFVISESAGLLAFNISDPTRPTLRAQYGALEFVTGIASKGHFVYYATGVIGYNPIYILEYRPDSASFLYYGKLEARGLGTFVFDSLLYVDSYDFRVYSISNPACPQVVDSLNLHTPVWQMAKRGDRLYASTQDSAILVFDATEPAHPRLLTRSQMRVGANQMALQDTVITSAIGTGMLVTAVPTPDSILDRSFFRTYNFPKAIALRGRIGYVASADAGLWSVDFSDPAHPRPIANLPAFGPCNDIAFQGDLAVCLGPSDGLGIAQISDTGRMSVVSTIRTGIGFSFAVQESLVAIGMRDSVVIYSIADPAHPRRLAMWTSHNDGDHSVVLRGKHLYVTEVSTFYGGGGFIVLDISDPATPQEIGRVLPYALAVLVEDTIAYVATCSGLAVVSISDPSTPSVIGSTNTTGGRSYVHLAKRGKYVFMTYDNIHAVDVADLTHPVEIPINPKLSLIDPNGLTISGDTLYVCDLLGGVWVIKSSLITAVETNDYAAPSSFQLLQNYPNPFNPTTHFDYALPLDTHVSLKIFNILGQEVATMVNAFQSAGYQSVEFDASNLPSGIYFYRLQAGKFVDVKKMVLIK